MITATDDFYVVYDHERYAIKTVTELEVPAYFLAIEATGGVTTYEVHSGTVFDRLLFTEALE